MAAGKPVEYTFIVDNRRYFINQNFQHPGGNHIFELLKGRDVTNEFHSYHQTSTAATVLSKFPSEPVSQPVTDGLEWTNYNELRDEVMSYYKKHLNWFTSMNYIRVAFAITFWLSSYYFYCTRSSLVWAIIFGIANGFCSYCSHEVIHFAFARNPIAFHSMTFFGHDSNQWFELHNGKHHYDTNLHNDPDIEHLPFIRHVESEPWSPMNKYQHFYSWFVYSITAFRYVAQPFSLNRKVHLFVLHFLIPTFFSSVSLVLVKLFLFLLIQSYYVGLINIINHTNDHVVFRPKTKDFVEHQLLVSANYGSTSMLHNICTVGLNNQIEHHLFPSVMTIAYPYLVPIIKAYCKKKNWPYHEEANFFGGLQSHFRHLRNLSVRN